MKKITISLFALAAVAGLTPACASADRPIRIDELPAAAQQTIEAHFKSAKVSYATIDEELFNKDYKVVFTDGMAVEFSSRGDWTQVDGERLTVPASIVPPQIREHVAGRFPEARIVKIERERRGYEVELDNGVELSFDTDFRLVEIDD